ncbi:MAG: carotene hydroxylase [Actinomycetota bacterium]
MDTNAHFAVATSLALATVGFFVMEVVTYLVHRFVMHGLLERLHLSHHRNAAAEFADKSFEPNDAFPLAFSVLVLAAMWAGFNVPGLSWIVPLSVGITLYGIVYTVVHDGIIHGRVRWMKRDRSRFAANLAVAHRAHHRTNGEPYGMLFPRLTMPRTETARYDPLRSGSRPSHVPADQ